jgi:AcrR family transcriptional regulator
MPAQKSESPSAATIRADPRSEQLRQRLLDAATELFLEKGYNVTSMTEIAARARASKETFYRHFPTKEALFRAVVVRRAEMMTDLGTLLSVDQPPEEALVAFGKHVLTRMTTEESLAFHRLLSTARERVPDLIHLYRTSGPYRVRDAVTAYLKSQVEQGRLRAMNPQVGARQFFDLVAAEMMINANITGKANPGRAAIRQRVKEAVDCFLHGYGA